MKFYLNTLYLSGNIYQFLIHNALFIIYNENSFEYTLPKGRGTKFLINNV